MGVVKMERRKEIAEWRWDRGNARRERKEKREESAPKEGQPKKKHGSLSPSNEHTTIYLQRIHSGSDGFACCFIFLRVQRRYKRAKAWSSLRE